MPANRDTHLGLSHNTLLVDSVDGSSRVPHRRLGSVPLSVSFLRIGRSQHQEPPEDALVLCLGSPPLLVEEAQRPHRLDPDLIIDKPLLVPPKRQQSASDKLGVECHHTQR